MKVALDVLGIGAHAGGIGRYVAGLPGALLEAEPDLELTLIVGREVPESLTRADWAGAVRWVHLPVATHGPGVALAQYGVVPALGLVRRCDLVHTPSNVGPPRVPGLPAVVTVHDLIWHHAGRDWGSAESLAAMERAAVRGARWATRVIVSSRSTREDLIRIADLPAAKVDVVPLAVWHPEHPVITGERELRARLELGAGPVLLSVAQKRPYKNLEAAIRAVAALGEDARLVLPGSPTPHEQELRALAERLGVAGRVRMIDWLEDAELEGLYRLATVVVVPSRYEGFGLPVLEAMARGVPVVCSDAASLPEVAGDAALLVDPDDQAAIDAAVARVVSDPELRADLARRGPAQAARFTWRRNADGVLGSYRRALAR